jgi:hypothetical protein
MGQKHVRLNIDPLHLDSSETFISLRKNNQKCEHPSALKEKIQEESEETIPYPSSISEVFEDSEDVPRRRVKIRKTLNLSVKHKKNFKKRIKQFEFQEFCVAKDFKENHVKFMDVHVVNTSKEFREKVRMFEKNESRYSLLRGKGCKKRRNFISELSWSGSCKNRMNTTLSTVRSWKTSYVFDDDW